MGNTFLRARAIQPIPAVARPAAVPSPDERIRGGVFETAAGFELGGWSHLVQGGIWRDSWNERPAARAYVFQIDRTEKGNWMWGDTGVGYSGRGTPSGHTDDWTFSWQRC